MFVRTPYADLPSAAAEYVASPGSATGVAAQKLYGENYARLQKLKKQYDPEGVFFKWNAITPQA